jgi:hypothetical protein
MPCADWPPLLSWPRTIEAKKGASPRHLSASNQYNRADDDEDNEHGGERYRRNAEIVGRLIGHDGRGHTARNLNGP